MNRKSRLDPVLESIEFPGEEADLIRGWLANRAFAHRVVEESRRLRIVSPAMMAWGGAALGLIAAAILTAGSPVLSAADPGAATLARLLLGLLMTISLAGFFAAVHPSWGGRKGASVGGTADPREEEAGPGREPSV